MLTYITLWMVAVMSIALIHKYRYIVFLALEIYLNEEQSSCYIQALHDNAKSSVVGGREINITNCLSVVLVFKSIVLCEQVL
jgi:hypothetical protein